jgi:hypothetical protein
VYLSADEIPASTGIAPKKRKIDHAARTFFKAESRSKRPGDGFSACGLASTRRGAPMNMEYLRCLETTVEIPDPIFREAKTTASKPWLECAGELAHLHEETLRIQKTIDEEFEQIEPISTLWAD